MRFWDEMFGRLLTRWAIVLMIVLGCNLVSAQSIIVSGTITDEHGNAISDVSISYSVKSQTIGTTSDAKGKYRIEIPAQQELIFHISHIAYEDIWATIEGEQNSLVKDFVLKETELLLDTVSVTAKMPVAKQSGDTTTYYAMAYKISDDASAYDLITQKINGISINDGMVEVQGEAVTDVMIDGKEYYKNDIALALKNLPAYIINEIQVFDKQSDYARLTGFEDATNRTKVINIVTKGKEDTKVLGKAYAGYGLDNRFDAYVSANVLNSRRTLSVFAQANNINKQDFSVLSLMRNGASGTPQQSPYSKGRANTFQQEEDLQGNMSANLGDGVSTVSACGVSFADKSANGKFSISGHYLMSDINNHVTYSIFDRYFLDTIADIHQEQGTDSRTMSHRANLKMEYQITPHDVVMLTPVVSYQRQKADGTTLLFQSAVDTLVNQQKTSGEQAFLGMGELNYVHKFKNRNDAFSVNVGFNYQNQAGNEDMNVWQSDAIQQMQRQQNDQSANLGVNGKASYILAINRASKLKADLGWGMTQLENASEAGLLDSIGLPRPDSLTSGMTHSSHNGLNGGLAFVYSNHGIDLSTGIDGKRLTQVTTNQRRAIDTTFFSVLPFLKVRYLPNTQNQIHFSLLSRLVTPSATQLHEADVVIDPSLSVRGNAGLLPATLYDASLRYVRNEVEKSQVFVCFAKYSLTRNPIVTERVFVSQAESATPIQPQLLTYRNTDRLQSSFDLLLAYGFPVSFIKSNVNVSSLLKQSHVPCFCNGVPTQNRLVNWNSSVTIGSNINEKVDFVIDLNLQYSNDRNEEFSSLSVSYWTFSYGGQVKFHPTRHLKFSFECGHTGYYGLSTDKYNALICNASASFVFGRNAAAEMQLSVNDIFDKNNNFYLYTTESYMRETSANVLGRHALLTFIYNFNKKNYTL